MTSNNLLDEFHSSTLNPPLLQSLLVKLLSHPKILNGFLDVMPTVQACLSKMEDGKRAALIKTIELFAYGTIHEYYELKATDSVWTLNDAQLEKLSMLSVASIARKQIDGINNSSPSTTDVDMMTDTTNIAAPTKKNKRKNKGGTNDMLSISYAKLAAELHIPNDGSSYNDKDHMRTLEDLLIQCIYSNVISAKLDQASKSLKSKFSTLNLFLLLVSLFYVLSSHICTLLQITVEPSVLLTPESIQAGTGSGTTASKGKKDASAIGGVYGSIFSRDMDTSTPESTNVEVSRMISTLESFLKQSNAVLSTLEHSSNEVASDRKMDEMRWREVQKVMDDTSSKGGRGGDGGEGLLGMMRLGDPMEVVDMGGRRQVKRSKGGHTLGYA